VEQRAAWASGENAEETPICLGRDRVLWGKSG
jgi:hypothetical protein